MESRFPHASRSSCNESESVCYIWNCEFTFERTSQNQIEILSAHEGLETYDRLRKGDSCLQRLHLQVQMTRQKKTAHVGFDWLPFLPYGEKKKHIIYIN